MQLLEKESSSIRQSLSARLKFLSSVDPISAFPISAIPVDVSGPVFSSSDCTNAQNCRLFLSSHLTKARNVVQMVLSSVEGSDTSKLAAELDDIIRSQSIVLEEISSANDSLNAVWSEHVQAGALTGFSFAASQADAVTKHVRKQLLQLLNKHIAWVQSIPKIVQTLHDSQFSRIFLEFLQANPSSKDSHADLYKLLRDVDVVVSDKINPNGTVLLEVRQWCVQQVTNLWRVYIRDSGQALRDSSPELFVGAEDPSNNFWNRQKAIPILSPDAWASMNLKDDIGVEPCDMRQNSFKEFVLNKQAGVSTVLKEIDSAIDSFEQSLKQKIKSSSAPAVFNEVLSKILSAKSSIKAGIKVLASAEEDSDFHPKFVAKYSKVFETTKLSTSKLVSNFQKSFSLESSQRIGKAFDPLDWVYKHSPLLSQSFLYFLQEKGAGVSHSSADSCHMLLLDVDLNFGIACIPNFQSFHDLRNAVCNCFLKDYSVLIPGSDLDPGWQSLVDEKQFHRRYVPAHFESIKIALPDFPMKYSERCVESLVLSLADGVMDKLFIERQREEFLDDVSNSVRRLTLLLKRYPVKDSELKFLKLLANLPSLGRLCDNKLKAYARKIDRYGSAYCEFIKELVASTQDLQSRIESRDNGLTKPEKVLEKADDSFQSLSKLFSKLCKAGNGLRKIPSLLEFCAEFVNFSMSASPDGVLSALLHLNRAESRLSTSLLPKLDAVEPFLMCIKEAGYVMKTGSEWFYPSHTRSLQLNGWSEKPDVDVPFMASSFFSEAAPFIQKDDKKSAEKDSLIFMVTNLTRRFTENFKKLGLASTDVLTNKLRQSVNALAQNIKDFSAANSVLVTTCTDIHTNSSKEYAAAIVSLVFDDKASGSIKRHLIEVHDAVKSLNQSLIVLQDLQFSRALLRITKDPAKEFWKPSSNSLSPVFVKLRDAFNALHAVDMKVSDVINPDGCSYLTSMEWFSHKLRTLEDWATQLSSEQIEMLNSLPSSESSDIQYWLRESAVLTLDPGAFDVVHWSIDKEQASTRSTAPRALNEAFQSLVVDSKEPVSELMQFAESSVKDACDAIESQFTGYSSLKAAKSKDAPKSGPVFDEFTAVNEIVQALESNSKKLKSAVQAVLENFNKLSSALSSFEKKTEATVSKIQEKLLSISATWEGKFNEAFKKYCKSMDVTSIHNGRFQLSQIFVDYWRVVGRSHALPVANSFLRILRCFDNDVIAFFRPATKPLLELRRHLISLRCRAECDASAIEECVFNLSEVLPVDKFNWPTQVSTRPSALVTYDRSQVMESRFSDVRVESFLTELRLRLANIKVALENARVL
jgi:hypothetical protein